MQKINNLDLSVFNRKMLVKFDVPKKIISESNFVPLGKNIPLCLKVK
jgi:hypothetical protein